MPYHGKRALDLTIAGTGLALTAPVQGLGALAIRVKMGCSVLFRQTRPGLGGEPLELVKFGTILAPDPERGLVDDADRHTPLGSFLRGTSLDELLARWHVVRSDMSIVGPRPLLISYLDRYTPTQARRHEVRPGLTGLARVSGRDAMTWDEKFAHDIAYVDDHSLVADLKIIATTVRQVLRRDGLSAQGSATMPEFMGAA